MRRNEVNLSLDAPRNSLLLIWAADPHKRLAVEVVVLDATSGQALETLSMAGAYCVGYHEHFVAGDTKNGAYVVDLVLADPDGWTLLIGGPGVYVTAAAREHGQPPVAASPESNAPSGKSLLVAGTPEHKRDRWERYQHDKDNSPTAWDFARWSKQYDTNMRNVIVGLSREREYCQAWAGENKTLKTAFNRRQIDIYRGTDDYCGQLKTGKVSLMAQAEQNLLKDAGLVDNFYQVEYILEKGASKNFLAALDHIGATYKIGPQIP